jgi:hypothetical protein
MNMKNYKYNKISLINRRNINRKNVKLKIQQSFKKK